MKGNPVFYKTLVVGVIVLFIGIGIQPAFAKDIYIKKGIKENLIENKSSDEYEEIFSLVFADAHWDWTERIGKFRGSIVFYVCGWCTGTNLFGLRRSNGRLVPYQERNLPYVYIPRFIGLIENPFFVLQVGIAIGNIEWYQ